jgi:hypothetical protein
VVIARLEKSKDSSIPFWTYTTQKLVTNKKAEIFPGFACSALDEDEYFYDWRSNPDHASRDSFFGTSGELTHAVDPSCGIGVKQLVMQRVRG